MSNPVSADIRERERINSSLALYLSLPTWTPAMGAMLVSGVFPAGNCTIISDANAYSLRSTTEFATARQILGAREVLANWVDWYISCNEESEVEALSSTVSPQDFLLWCDEEYENRADRWKPAWLSYWNSYIGLHPCVDAPSPAPGNLVAYASKLDGFAEVIGLDLSQGRLVLGVSPSDSPKSVRESYVTKLTDMIEANSRLWFKDVIIKAVKDSTNPKNPTAVFAQIRKLAKSGTYTDLRYCEEKEEVEISAGEKWKTYEKKALTLFLDRYRDMVDQGDS